MNAWCSEFWWGYSWSTLVEGGKERYQPPGKLTLELVLANQNKINLYVYGLCSLPSKAINKSRFRHVTKVNKQLCYVTGTPTVYLHYRNVDYRMPKKGFFCKMGQNGSTCAVATCNSPKDVSYHRFPSNSKQQKIWVLACKRKDAITVKTGKKTS